MSNVRAFNDRGVTTRYAIDCSIPWERKKEMPFSEETHDAKYGKRKFEYRYSWVSRYMEFRCFEFSIIDIVRFYNPLWKEYRN